MTSKQVPVPHRPRCSVPAILLILVSAALAIYLAVNAQLALERLAPAESSELSTAREQPLGGAEYKNFSAFLSIKTLTPFVTFPLVISPVPGATFTVDGNCPEGTEGVRDVAAESLEAVMCFAREYREWLKELRLVHGALLFRGFEVGRAEQFEAFVKELLLPDSPFRGMYLGTSPRLKDYNHTSGVYTASEIPSEAVIPAHLEMSFRRNPPNKIIFWAELPNRSPGGETPLVDFRQVWRDLRPDVAKRFKEKGVRYIRHYYSQQAGGEWSVFPLTYHRSFTKSWEAMFETEDDKTATSIATAQGFDVDWYFDSSKLLRLSHRMNATREHPETGEEQWNNHLSVLHMDSWADEYISAAHRTSSTWHRIKLFYQYFKAKLAKKILLTLFRETTDVLGTHVVHGDGEEIRADDMLHFRRVMSRNTVTEPWQKGDVMFLDNYRIAHGRHSFSGPRSILTAWSETQR